MRDSSERVARLSAAASAAVSDSAVPVPSSSRPNPSSPLRNRDQPAGMMPPSVISSQPPQAISERAACWTAAGSTSRTGPAVRAGWQNRHPA